MTSHEISWRKLDAADHVDMDATAVWGAFVGAELVFGITEAPDEEFDDDLDGEPAPAQSPIYTTWVVMTSEQEGFDGWESLDGYETLQEAQQSVAGELAEWKRMREQS